LADQVLVFAASETGPVNSEKLMRWAEYDKKSYFFRVLDNLHSKRYIEFNKAANTITILSPGLEKASKIIATPQK
jgi:hypothetical protein